MIIIIIVTILINFCDYCYHYCDHIQLFLMMLSLSLSLLISDLLAVFLSRAKMTRTTLAAAHHFTSTRQLRPSRSITWWRNTSRRSCRRSSNTWTWIIVMVVMGKLVKVVLDQESNWMCMVIVHWWAIRWVAMERWRWAWSTGMFGLLVGCLFGSLDGWYWR